MFRDGKAMACALVIAMVTAHCVPAVSTHAQTGDNGQAPEILSPRDGERIGEGEDARCPPAPAPCSKIEAQGKVPPGLTPFFGVEPRMASPWIWIQAPIHSIRSDGTFAGLVHLGEAHVGMEQKYTIHLFACKDGERFQEGERIRQLPKDCRNGESVEVYRVR